MNQQERLWAGKFGNDYHERNAIRDPVKYWEGVLWGRLGNVHSAVEFGAGKGDNLVALRTLIGPSHNQLTGVEINANACMIMRDNKLDAAHCPAREFMSAVAYDLAFTRGFLIHVPTGSVNATLDKIYKSSRRFICLAEYYSPKRRQVTYHGKQQALWTDDFAGRMMELHPELQLVNYGFDYHLKGGDDLTYFLMEKPQ